MLSPTFEPIPSARFQIGGVLKPTLHGLIDHWLLIAPIANPAMLEMFRDRDAPPQRELVPWAGEFAGKYLTAAVQVLRLTGDARLAAWLHEFTTHLLSVPGRRRLPRPLAARAPPDQHQTGRQGLLGHLGPLSRHARPAALARDQRRQARPRGRGAHRGPICDTYLGDKSRAWSTRPAQR